MIGQEREILPSLDDNLRFVRGIFFENMLYLYFVINKIFLHLIGIAFGYHLIWLGYFGSDLYRVGSNLCMFNLDLGSDNPFNYLKKINFIYTINFSKS